MGIFRRTCVSRCTSGRGKRIPPAPSPTGTVTCGATRSAAEARTDKTVPKLLPHFGWNASSTCLCPNSPHCGRLSLRVRRDDYRRLPTSDQRRNEHEPRQVVDYNRGSGHKLPHFLEAPSECRIKSASRLRCRPSASKFSGANHCSYAALSAGHSRSTMENHALSLFRCL